MANRELKTKIKLRYDLLANWTEKNPELLAGEIAIVAIPSGVTEMQVDGSQPNPPQILFKVGPGHFNDLSYASAKAADVYGWAKAASKPTYTAAEVGAYSKTELDPILAGIDHNTTYRFDLSKTNEIAIYSKEIGGEESLLGTFKVDFEAINAEIAKKLDSETFNNFESDYNTTIGGINESLAKKLEANDIAGKADTTDVDNKLAGKVNISDYNAKVEEIVDDIKELSGLVDEDIKEINESITGINNKFADYYTRTEVDGEVTTIENWLGDLDEELDTKVNASDYNTKMESLDKSISDLSSNKADKSELKDWELKSDAELVRGRVSTLEGHFGDNGRVTVAESKISTAEGKISTLEGKVGNLSGAFQFQGTAESLDKLPAASSANKGHVYVIGNKEYASDGSSWILLGDEGSYVLKTTYEAHLLAQEAVDQGQSDKIKAIEDDIKANRESWASKTSVTDPTAGDGKITVNGVEMVVYDDSKLAARVKSLEDNPYKLPSDVVQDANYKHITVTETSVSDGTTTFSKYDDTELAGKVSTVEGKVKTLEETTIPGINNTISTLATKDEVAGVAGKIDGVIADYLKGEDKTELQGKIDKKQNIIDDLETIRSGAALGATAVQPSAIEDMLTKTEAATTYETIDNVKSVSDRVKVVEDNFADWAIIWDCGGAE
jgi:hypothetical protein